MKPSKPMQQIQTLILLRMVPMGNGHQWTKWTKWWEKPSAATQIKTSFLTLFLTEGTLKPPWGFSCAIAKRLEIESWNFLTYNGHSLRSFCEFFGQNQVRSGHQGHQEVSWPSFKKVRNHAMITVNVGSVWNLQDCLVISAPIKRMPRNFYPGDTRSCQFRELHIISLWGKWKCFSFRINRSKPSNSFRIMATHPICADLGATDDRGHGRSPEVKWRHNPIFANMSRQDGYRDAKMVPNNLARRAASDDVHIDLLGPWSDLGLTWPGVKFSNWPFKVKKYTFRTGLTRQTQWCHFFVSLVSKKL